MSARRALATLVLVLVPGIATAQSTHEIFHIASNKNKNLVRYDARVGKDGQLDPKEPVFHYKIAPDGHTWKVATIDSKLFYGFRVRLDKSGEFWHLTLVAAKDRPMRLYLKDGRARAEGKIAGVPAFLEELYVKFAEKTVLPSVAYIDLIGVDAKTGEPRRERVVPK